MKRCLVVVLCLAAIAFGIDKRYIRPRPTSKGLVCSVRLTEGFLSGVVCQEETNTYTATASGGTGTPLPKYPGFDFVAASTQYIDIGTGPTSTKTISLWVKQDDVAGDEFPLDLNGTDYIAVESGVVTVYGLVGHSLYVNGVAGTSGVTAITAVWSHIAVTDATANDATDLDIGRVTAAYYDGLISEVRLYNRVLTATEIKDIYELTRWRYQK